MAYMNRVCSLISDGKPVVHTAVLYHADSEWAGEAMLTQKVTRLLMENQIECHVIPADVFAERERYQTELTAEGFSVNGNQYDTLIVPAAKHIPQALVSALEELKNAGCKVLFVDKLPDEVENGTVAAMRNVVQLVPKDLWIEPCHWRIRTFHYKGTEEIFYLVNEDDKPYSGVLTIPAVSDCYSYDAWKNKTYVLTCKYSPEHVQIPVSMEPGESWIIVVGSRESHEEKAKPFGTKICLRDGWKRSVCKAIDYPNFTDEKGITAFGDYGKENKHFSGFIAYETKFERPAPGHVVLEITDAGEDVEAFVNGASAGIQALPPFCFDISDLLQDGQNTLRIEVATTLERERRVNKKNWAPIGILGEVNLYHG